MKTFVLCACILVLASFSSATVKQKLTDSLHTEDPDHVTCREEHGMHKDEWYEIDDLVHNRHKESDHAERSRKNGCTLHCVMKKHGVMDGSEVIMAQMHTKVDEEFTEPEVRIVAHKIMNDCVKEAEHITDACEKSLEMYACTAKAIHELQEDHHEESHEEEHH